MAVMRKPLSRLQTRRRIMHRSRSTGILFAVAVLIVSLAAPAAAKKGGNPGPPSGSGLEVTVESSGFMWANSPGDRIWFDITVTNTSGGLLTGVTVYFSGTLLATDVDLVKNDSWVVEYPYTVVGSISLDGNTGDFADATISEQTSVTVGTVTAAAGTVSDSEDVVMAAYPVLPCNQIEDGPFYFTTTENYSVCSFTGSGNWKLTTTLDKPPRGKSNNPSATVRDGVPGNWCNTGDSVVDGMNVIDYQSLPDDGICLGGGAGGDTITVRNTNTFYLATWKGNTVFAEPLTTP
jgi:hypothetical protein